MWRCGDGDELEMEIRRDETEKRERKRDVNMYICMFVNNYSKSIR